MPKFVPNSETEEDKASQSSIEKAREDAEIQKCGAEAAESKRQAIFAENDIKDTNDLKRRLEELGARETEFEKKQSEFEETKASTMSQIQADKAELEQVKADIEKKEQSLQSRLQNLAVREQSVDKREEMLNQVEKEKLQKDVEYNSLQEQLGRNYIEVSNLIQNNAMILAKAGYRRLASGILEELKELDTLYNNGISKHVDQFVVWMKGQVDDCNKKAVIMARNPRQYGEVHNQIVDNLEKVYSLLPVLKPEYLPGDD